MAWNWLDEWTGFRKSTWIQAKWVFFKNSKKRAIVFILKKKTSWTLQAIIKEDYLLNMFSIIIRFYSKMRKKTMTFLKFVKRITYDHPLISPRRRIGHYKERQFWTIAKQYRKVIRMGEKENIHKNDNNVGVYLLTTY